MFGVLFLFAWLFVSLGVQCESSSSSSTPSWLLPNSSSLTTPQWFRNNSAGTDQALLWRHWHSLNPIEALSWLWSHSTSLTWFSHLNPHFHNQNNSSSNVQQSNFSTSSSSQKSPFWTWWLTSAWMGHLDSFNVPGNSSEELWLNGNGTTPKNERFKIYMMAGIGSVLVAMLLVVCCILFSFGHCCCCCNGLRPDFTNIPIRNNEDDYDDGFEESNKQKDKDNKIEIATKDNLKIYYY